MNFKVLLGYTHLQLPWFGRFHLTPFRRTPAIWLGSHLLRAFYSEAQGSHSAKIFAKKLASFRIAFNYHVSWRKNNWWLHDGFVGCRRFNSWGFDFSIIITIDLVPVATRRDFFNKSVDLRVEPFSQEELHQKSPLHQAMASFSL